MKKGLFSKFIVIFIILANVIFAVKVFDVFIATNGLEPSTLIASWFAFTTGELWALSKIKRDDKGHEDVIYIEGEPQEE